MSVECEVDGKRRQHQPGSHDHAGSPGGNIWQHGQEGEVGIHTLPDENHVEEK